MKKGLFKHGIAILGIAVLAFFSLACASTESTVALQSDVTVTAQTDVTNRGSFGESVIIPVKDFQTLGLVFTEHVYQLDAADADIFTYQALLKEAKKLGADAIINVIIDRRRQTITETTRASGWSSNTSTSTRTYVQETWYGSALAIKYTDALMPEKDTIINRPRETSTGSSSASESSSSSSNKKGFLGLGRKAADQGEN